MPGDFIGTGVGIFFVLFGLVFVIVMGGILVAVVKGIGQWSYNNGQPVQSAAATVVTKRTQTWGGGGSNGSSVNTSYYVTFQTQDGERREMGMSGSQYGLLVEGDEGTLTHQGTRYKSFARTGVGAR